ncbi:MAG: hypothetical protein GVY36_09360 [Verrucomicrobia bacterium]|nr:hypothetical protein [Verrucomicrobiota bacterium]
MNTQHYELRLNGLEEADGQIKAHDLHRVLGALLKTAERTTRLIATGEGVSQGARPTWLEKSVDFTVTGIRKGSTILQIDAPLLADTAGEQFAQTDFWRQTPEHDDTALDLACLAIQEAQSESVDSGDFFDSSVLDAALEFKNSVKAANIHYEFTSTTRPKTKFALSETSFDRIKEMRRSLPEPRAFIVSGKLDEIKHSAGRFRLLMPNGQSMLGRVHPEFLDGEHLRPLWGNPVTVEGMVHFKANGQARLIEARKLSPKAEGDTVFEALPCISEAQNQRDLFPELSGRTPNQSSDPMVLWGAWPGDEPLESLLAELD